MTPDDFMQLRPDTPGYVNYTEAGRSAAKDNKPKPFNADKTFGSVKAASGLGLRDSISRSTKSRMALPFVDVAKSAVQGLGTTASPSQLARTEVSDLDRLKGAYDTDYKYRALYGNQDIDLTKRKIREVDTLANNEANRAMSMSLATQFPYKKYETESSSAREIMNNAQSAIPTFLNRATASRINPVSLSL